MILTGRIQAVYDVVAGTEVGTFADIGDTTVYIMDADWASEDGGDIMIGDEPAHYDQVEFDDLWLLLSDPLTETHETDELVRPVPAVKHRYCEVWIDGEDAEDDPEPAIVFVPNWMRDRVPVGTRGDTGERVRIVDQGGEWRILDFPGEPMDVSAEYAPPERVLRYTAHQLEEGHRSEALKGYTGTAYWARAATDGDPPSDDTEFDLLLNGDVLATVTIKAGKRKGRRVDFDATPFVETDRFKVEHVDIEDLTPDVFVYVFVKLDTEKVTR